MKKTSLYASALAAMMVGIVAQAADTTKTLADVGATAIANDPNVELVNRGDGTYALVFKSAKMTKNWGDADYSTTFTFNSMWNVKEFLVVGGGGAGGGNVGAGGGGGGVIYFTEELLAADAVAQNAQTNFENGSQIAITIGAGGVSAFKRKGTSGGHSTLTLGAKTYTAFGGGGGGDYGDDGQAYWIATDVKDDGNPVTGADGNTGCGAGVYNGKKGTNGYMTSMPVLTGDAYGSNGYYGTGGGDNNGGNACGGGGGAGEAGGSPPPGVNNIGGNGGDGLPCSITGTEVYYAAGGAGADKNQERKDEERPQGGRGGGGHASIQIGRASPETATRPSEGTDATGFGCGGGGGVGGSSGTATGGNGSAGIVILLIEPVEIVSDKPVASAIITEQGANYAKFSVSVLADGLDNTTSCAVYGGLAKNAEEIVCAQVSNAVAVNGSVAQTVAGLEVGATYFYRFYAVNGSAVEGDFVTGSFTLSAGEIDPTSSAPVITSGGSTVIGTSVSVPYCVAWPGAGKEACSVTLRYGLLADKLSYSSDFGSWQIGNGQGQISGLIPGRRYYLQLTADNGVAQTSTEVFSAVIGDGEAFPTAIDARQPVIAGIGGLEGFVCGGSGILYSGTFTNYVEGMAVTLHYFKDGEWLTSEATVMPEGFSGSVDGLTYSTDYPYYFTATAGDFADCTQEKSFNSKGAGVAAGWTYDWSVRFQSSLIKNLDLEDIIGKTRITVLETSVTDLGCGTNTYLCLIAKKRGADEWFVVASNKVTQTGPAYILTSDEEAEAFDFGSTYDIRLSVRNTAFDGNSWESIAGQERYFTAQDSTAYTWCGTDGSWSDEANWTTGNGRRDGTAGYPVYGSTANFGESAAATVRVDRVETAANVSLKGGTVCFSGENPVLRVTNGAGVPSGQSATLLFDIPKKGFAEVPMQSTASGQTFPNSSGSLKVEVAPTSGYLVRIKDGSQQLIGCAKGIVTNRIEFVENGVSAGTFRYVWPESDPERTGNPTELWLDVVARPGGLSIILR